MGDFKTFAPQERHIAHRGEIDSPTPVESRYLQGVISCHFYVAHFSTQKLQVSSVRPISGKRPHSYTRSA